MKHRCMALSANGQQCRKTAVVSQPYHGSGDLYDYFNGLPRWVRVELCEKHRVHKDGRKIPSGKEPR